MFREEFERRGLAPQVLTRAVEDSGTVTSPLVPWNTCGAYMSGVLGVSTASYLPYCFFNLLSPVLDVVYGFLGFKVPTKTPPPGSPPPDPAGAARPMSVLTGYSAASASLHSAVTLSRSLRTVSACARTPSPSNKPPNASMYALAQPAAALPLA